MDAAKLVADCAIFASARATFDHCHAFGRHGDFHLQLLQAQMTKLG
jgi:hypothetical protein